MCTRCSEASHIARSTTITLCLYSVCWVTLSQVVHTSALTHIHTNTPTYCIFQSSIVSLKQLLCPTHPFLLPGGPGSGKGTHCARVVSEFNFAHLSTGDLLRGEVEKGSPLGREVAETMRQGKLVPSVSCLEEGVVSEFKQVESCLGVLLKVL